MNQTLTLYIIHACLWAHNYISMKFMSIESHTYNYATRSDKIGLIARQILTIISKFEIL